MSIVCTLHISGMDLCREQVYGHLIKVQNKKLTQNKLNEKETQQLEKLKEAHTEIKSKNEVFTMSIHKCPTCSFRTESKVNKVFACWALFTVYDELLTWNCVAGRVQAYKPAPHYTASRAHLKVVHIN